MKNEKKNDNTPMIKTKVRPNKTIEVEMKAPQKSTFGRILIWVLIGGMTLLGLAVLIVLIAQVAGNL